MKYAWTHGQNKFQNFYEVNIGNDYLLVFAMNSNPNLWMGSINGKMIYNRTKNNRIRRQCNFSKHSPVNKLPQIHILSRKNAYEMMKSVEYCYRKHKTEIFE